VQRLLLTQVEGLDLVVGGHTNTLLWNGTNPISADEVPHGPYPTVVRQQNTGLAVPVVQTSG
jgi:5'-nucleotidase